MRKTKKKRKKEQTTDFAGNWIGNWGESMSYESIGALLASVDLVGIRQALKWTKNDANRLFLLRTIDWHKLWLKSSLETDKNQKERQFRIFVSFEISNLKLKQMDKDFGEIVGRYEMRRVWWLSGVKLGGIGGGPPPWGDFRAEDDGGILGG